MTVLEEGARGATWQADGQASSRHRGAWRRRLPEVMLGCVVVASTGLYLALSRPLWFFGDDWDFLLRRGTVPGADLGVWMPHNEHWSTGPILLFRAMFELFGLRWYLPYAVPVLLAHAAAVVLVYLLLVRFAVHRWAALAVAAVLAFNGAGAENLLWAFQIGFVGSVALGYLGLWLYDRFDAEGWRIWPTWAALVAGLTFSTIGVVMVVYVAVYAGFRRGLRGAAAVASLPAAVFLTWFLLFGRQSAGPGLGADLRTTLRLLPSYIWTGLSHAWERVSAMPGSGSALVLVLLGSLVALGIGRCRHLAWAGTVAAFVQLALSGVGRAGVGVEQATASRYTYLVVAMMAPALAVVLDVVVRRLPSPRWVSAGFGLALLALVVLQGIGNSILFRDERLVRFGSLRDRILASAELVRDGAVILHRQPEGEDNPDITTDLLGSPRILSELPAITPSQQGQLDAAANLQVSVSTSDLALPAPIRLALVDGFAGPVDPSPGCHTYAATSPRPTLEMAAGPAGAQVRITSDSNEMHTRLQRDGRLSDVVPWATQGGVSQVVGTSAGNVSLLVTLGRGGSVSVCG